MKHFIGSESTISNGSNKLVRSKQNLREENSDGNCGREHHETNIKRELTAGSNGNLLNIPCQEIKEENGKEGNVIIYEQSSVLPVIILY